MGLVPEASDGCRGAVVSWGAGRVGSHGPSSEVIIVETNRHFQRTCCAGSMTTGVAAWQSSPGPDGPWSMDWIEVVHVSPARIVSERRLQDTSNWISDLSITEQGGLGALKRSPGCSLQIVHPDGVPVAGGLNARIGTMRTLDVR